MRYSSIARSRLFLKHYFKSKNAYHIHSPFVFEFYQKVLKNKEAKPPTIIENLREEASRNQKLLEIEDFGAGSKGQPGIYYKKSLAQLARKAARRKREGKFLYNLCKFYQPQKGLELGTQLGFSAMYQLSGNPGMDFHTLEGSNSIAQEAQNHFSKAKMSPRLSVGEFSESLASIDWNSWQPDYVFLDGNHTYQATIDYVSYLLPLMAKPGIVVLDDIYWSEGMQRAWEEIVAIPEITVSIDLFVFGVCFVSRPQAKEHFSFSLY